MPQRADLTEEQKKHIVDSLDRWLEGNDPNEDYSPYKLEITLQLDPEDVVIITHWSKEDYRKFKTLGYYAMPLQEEEE